MRLKILEEGHSLGKRLQLGDCGRGEDALRRAAPMMLRLGYD